MSQPRPAANMAFSVLSALPRLPHSLESPTSSFVPPRLSYLLPARRHQLGLPCMSASPSSNTPTPSSFFGKSPRKPSPSAPVVLIFGGGSVLGLEIQRLFSAAGYRVVTLDFYDQSVPCGGVNGCALPQDGVSPVSLALPSWSSPRVQVRIAETCLRSARVQRCDIMVNATLGYAAAGLSGEDLFDTVEYMYKTSVESSMVTARLAKTFLAPGGLLAMLGSVAALSPQPEMLGYSAAKAAVHQIVRSLAVTVGSELPDNAAVVAIVPEVLDTPLHRSMNNGIAGSHWTPCDAVAAKLLHWATNKNSRPPNASLVSVSTQRTGTEDTEHHFRLLQNPSFVQSTAL